MMHTILEQAKDNLPHPHYDGERLETQVIDPNGVPCIVTWQAFRTNFPSECSNILPFRWAYHSCRTKQPHE